VVRYDRRNINVNFVSKRVARVRKLWLRTKGYSARAAAYLQDAVDFREQSQNDGSNSEECGKRQDSIAEKDYLYLHPINGKYDKWVRDRITTSMVLEPFRQYFEQCLFHFQRRGESLLIIALVERSNGYSNNLDGVYSLLLDSGPLTLVSSAWRDNWRWAIEAGDGHFFIDKVKYTFQETEAILYEHTKQQGLVLIKPAGCDINQVNLSAQKVEMVIINSNGMNPQLFEMSVVLEEQGGKRFGCDLLDDADMGHIDHGRPTQPYGVKGIMPRGDTAKARQKEHDSEEPLNNLQEMKTAVTEMCRYIPQIKFLVITAVVTNNSTTIVSLSSFPPYSSMRASEDDVQKFLCSLLLAKRKKWSGFIVKAQKMLHCCFLAIRRRFARLLSPKGLLPYLCPKWLHNLVQDFVTIENVSLRDKIWAYQHGFLSYRLPQYGITKENWREYIADYEYYWLKHINSKYRYILDDKITIKYILAGYEDIMPDYFYLIDYEEDSHQILSLQDLPTGYNASLDSLISFVRQKNTVAMKPVRGSHGEGFYKLAYKDCSYELNHKRLTEQQVRSFLQNLHEPYLLTEYVQQHQELGNIYQDSVNTIRVIVLKHDGIKPSIGNAYMRIGSKRSGVVDNMAAGGMYAQIDICTGRYGNGSYISKGSIKPCAIHPDTGTKIEGYLPFWETIKEQILDIASQLAQIEYFGFDLTITGDGFKIIEINRFPDFPKIEPFSSETERYLLNRLEEKKKQYGYNASIQKKLLALPIR
jgi:hypothetical protein